MTKEVALKMRKELSTLLENESDYCEQDEFKDEVFKVIGKYIPEFNIHRILDMTKPTNVINMEEPV